MAELTIHVHKYVTTSRIRGTKQRCLCECGALGPWTRFEQVPKNNPLRLQAKTVTELRELAKSRGLHVTTKMTKTQLITALTEVRP